MTDGRRNGLSKEVSNVVVIIAPFRQKLYKGFNWMLALESGKGGEGSTEINGLLLTEQKWRDCFRHAQYFTIVLTC